ncbi:unnamed protein product [Alternaria alternata]
MAELAPFEHTPMDDIAPTCAKVRASFLSHKTKPLEYRIQQLRKLYWGFKDNEELIKEACKRDLGKPSFKTCLTEIIVVHERLHLDGQQLHASRRPIGHRAHHWRYNFPIQLTLGPLIGAIAAGCTAIVKPSESAPQRRRRNREDPARGAIPETTALLDQKWDKIFYTGGEVVAKIIAKKAAETLTPLTLELGGRNPAIVTKHADPKLAARRLLWAKTLNAGQVCLSQNCTFVDREIVPAFIEEMKKQLHDFYPDGARNSPDYGRIVNERQFQRMKKMLDASNGKIINDMNDSMVTSESFGPLLPILPVSNLDEAIRIANEIHDTPLGTYAFGNKAELEQIMGQTRSGGASLNDGFFHGSIPTMPFGGVGTSGQGAYRGKASFDTFTHRRSVTTTPAWLEGLMDVRYPPYTLAKQKKFIGMNDVKPNFDRQGRALGWGAWFMGLVGLKSLAAVVAAVAIRLYLQRRAKM